MQKRAMRSKVDGEYVVEMGIAVLADEKKSSTE